MPELFPLFLIQLHTIIRASVPLMEAALSRAETLAETDPVAVKLAEYFTKHIPEERHHDDWLLQDLECLGFSRQDVLARMPSPTVAAMVGAQYYWIFHHHPVALMGYVGVMEGSPPNVDHVEEVIRRTGLPRKAFSTYLKHADLDPHHRDDLDRALDRFPLEPEHSALIGTSAFQTVHLTTAAITELVTRFDKEQG